MFDFFFQTDKMAKNKSTSNLALLEHVVVYTYGICMIWTLNISKFEIWQGLAFILINAVAHFVTDWVTSRATSALYKEERYHDFFVVIGVDQFCHYLVLFGTFIWLTNL
jgi:uncharacterized membrane protein